MVMIMITVIKIKIATTILIMILRSQKLKLSHSGCGRLPRTASGNSKIWSELLKLNSNTDNYAVLSGAQKLKESPTLKTAKIMQ